MRQRVALALAVVAALAVAGSARAELPPLPPSPTRHVTDGAGLLSPVTAQALDARLYAYEKQTGHQILVWIGDTTGPWPLDDWAVRTFAAWKVGRKGQDDGLVVFILAKDRKIDIEVGYGLEDRIPDARAKQIIDDIIAPGLRAGKADEAVTAAVDRILSLIEGHPVADQPVADGGGQPAPHLSLVNLVFLGIFGVVLLVLIVTHPRLALFFLISIMSGGRGGGFGGGFGGGGGGGWSGGGGRSGGGGARGSW